MKNPNGYGSVIKLGGKRRRPFAARVTAGWDDNGKQLYEYIGYYETRADAMIGLALYNSNPYDLTKITFTEVYDAFFKEKFSEKRDPPLSAETKKATRNSYNHSKHLHDLIFKDIKTIDLQNVIDNCGKGHSTKSAIKTLFNQIYAYAMAHDLAEKDYSSFVVVGANTAESKSKPFSDKEIKLLWDNVGKIEDIDLVLIMIYSGLRISELLEIETANVDLENRFMQGGIKTKAGKDRMIPLNKKIIPFIEKRFDENEKLLIIRNDGKKMTYRHFYEYIWKVIMMKLKLEQKPHDTRHTFATLMDNAEANKVSIQRILGHSSKGVTDKVYTHKDLEQLIKAIDLI